MIEDQETDPVYQRYRARLRSFFTEIVSLPMREFENVANGLDEPPETDLASIYLSGITRTSMLWLIWEDYCRGNAAQYMETCRSIEDELVGGTETRIGGVSSFFNTTIKSLIAKMYADLSPGIVIPSWIVTYSAFVGDKLVLRLASLPLGEQLRRFPLFASVLGVIDPVFRALLDYYSTKGSDFAYVAAEYMYWEVIRPCTLLYTVVVDELGCARCEDIARNVYLVVLSSLEEDDTEPPRIGTKTFLDKLLHELRNHTLRRLREERLRALKIGP